MPDPAAQRTTPGMSSSSSSYNTSGELKQEGGSAKRVKQQPKQQGSMKGRRAKQAKVEPEKQEPKQAKDCSDSDGE
eukprot:8568204-Alexandrium_andersonii.AAC.1